MAESLISCKNAWKLFGHEPQKYLASLDKDPGFDALLDAGYVAAVRDANFEVRKGEMLVVMGLSGSGKSTLVRCLSRLVDLTQGQVFVDGEDIHQFSERELIQLRREKMGMVFQSFGLLPHRTVLDNIAFPLEMRGQDVHQRRARAMEVIELVGLQGRERYFPRELSGGQQQRVGIARSLAIEPDIWFLDEPFSALDPLIRREMQAEFLRLQSMLGKTIVFITHDFDEALRLADRIAIMKDGAIEQIGAASDIVLNPATPYVAKFTEEVEKSRVVRARDLMVETTAASGVESDSTVAADATIRELSRRLFEDSRAVFPVADDSGQLVGDLHRSAALDVLLGAEA